MRTRPSLRFLAVFLCVALLAACLPLTVFAADGDTQLVLTEGDVVKDFAPAGTECTSSDSSIAWVDENGSLNALKPGTVTVSVPGEESSTDYEVTVEDFSDGSEIIGNLKILARYNDSMQFYDGHVYLLFTSYADGVTVTVPDLYAGYDILPAYYSDIRQNISWGSNHTGSNADTYFMLNEDMNSVTLNRGEIVTIGMYRDFDLSVPQAALGCIKNSSAWKDIKAAGKTAVIETLFKFLDSGDITAQEALDKLKAELAAIGSDYTKLMDGVVDGGVCFNRELYNQKLEWDQYENVTYEMDITKNQLDTLQMYLGGNLNKFSLFKNSCATVALRAWNAAVGTRNGEDSAYHLDSAGDGIFAIIDAPKGVRDSIVNRLPGYYLNNAEGVAEPGAGYQDDTGWVYVSAPEKVGVFKYDYVENAVKVDENRTSSASLFKLANGGVLPPYTDEDQQVDCAVKTSPLDDATQINGIDFSLNGKTVSIDETHMPEDGIWFMTRNVHFDDYDEFYVVDGDGNLLPSDYNEEWIYFCAKTLPVSFSVTDTVTGKLNPVEIEIVNADKSRATTEIYTKDDEEKTTVENGAELENGTKIYIKSEFAEDSEYVLSDITLNDFSVVFDGEYDETEGAYCATMPVYPAKLTVDYEPAFVKADKTVLQAEVEDVLKVTDFAKLYIGDDEAANNAVKWAVFDDPDGVLSINGRDLTCVKPGSATVAACAESNENVCMLYYVQVYDSFDEMVEITYDEETAENAFITYSKDSSEPDVIPYSGYLVEKGSALDVSFVPLGKTELPVTVRVNGKDIRNGVGFIVEEDSEIDVIVREAQVKGMPSKVKLDAKGDTYQLDAKLSYNGVYALIPVYCPDIHYASSDESMITVDENGLITVVGEVPEDGAAVIVTAYSTMNNVVSADTKVVIGDYSGDKLVGRITVSARSIAKGELVPHGMFTFTTYEDIDMDVSFYEYYRPNEKYNDLMLDYKYNPEKYSSDPALCNDNELGLEDRQSYFDIYSNGPESDARTVSLVAGETITMSNYGFDDTNITAILRALEGSTISYTPQTQELMRQMRLYSNGDEYDGAAAFDSLLATLVYMYQVSKATGQNPADGHSAGGMCIDREIYNQFRRNDTQFPNNYYTIEITADELVQLRGYLANPANNYYSLFTKNCAGGVVDMWNTTLFDKPELHLESNLTGLSTDPQSLYFEVGALRLKGLEEGEGGTDFCPHTIRDRKPEPALTGDVNGDGVVDINDATYVQMYAAELMEFTDEQKAAGDVNGDGVVDVNDATYIQMYSAELIDSFDKV